MIDQNLFNLVVGVCGGLGAWLMAIVWGSVRDAHKKFDDVSKQINEHTEKTNDKFVSKDEYRETVKGLRLDINSVRESIDKGLASVQSLLTQILMQKKD